MCLHMWQKNAVATNLNKEKTGLDIKQQKFL